MLRPDLTATGPDSQIFSHGPLIQYDEALAELVKVEVNYAYPEYSSKALLEMGNALVQKGNMEAAQSQFREVVEKYPESEAAKVAKTQIK